MTFKLNRFKYSFAANGVHLLTSTPELIIVYIVITVIIQYVKEPLIGLNQGSNNNKRNNWELLHDLR